MVRSQAKVSGLAVVSDDGIVFWRARGVADVLDPMICIVEHGPDEMVEPAVDADEGAAPVSLRTLTFVMKYPHSLTRNLPGLEPDLQGAAAGVGV